ncbi:MAG TPA: NTP transferase domain-containing protein [Candidatus Binataceae bacterium]|nr:NTP transferase domain-containing protein [Candidatus Binataceae bacterium]
MAERLSGAIIAAGRGERLRPASGAIPKPLVELNGEPLLMRQIRELREAGASPIHAIVNSETHRLMLERRLALAGDVDLTVRDTTSSMESLLTLGERIRPGRFVLTTVDAVLTTHEMARFVTNATKIATTPESGLDGALGVVKWRGDSRPLFARVAADGVIAALGDRHAPMVTAGVYWFTSAIFDYAAEARARGLDALRRFLALLIEKSMKFAALELEQVIDVDEEADLAAARAMLAREAQALTRSR